jgi:integrase
VTFYLGDKRDYEVRSINKALKDNYISKSDAALIRQYVSEKIATHQISRNRVLKLYTTLLGWKKNRLIVTDFKELTMMDLYSAMQSLSTVISQTGKPLAQNTQHDYVVILKAFLLWMIEDQINSSLIEKKVRAIKTPPKNQDTTHPDEILQPEELKAMIKACTDSRNRALIAVQYEAATRIGELGHMVWRDVHFDEYGAQLLIRDTKTKKVRHSRVTNAISARYLATWRDDYPGIPEGDEPVFLSERGGPLTYYAIRKIFLEAKKKAGIERRIYTHLFRKSRGTHLIEQGLPEASVKNLMWGNQSTRMLETYIRISPVEQDRILLKHAGIITDEENKQQERRVSGPMCSNCHTQNSPTSKYCGGCGIPLTEDAVRKHQLTQEFLRNPEVLSELFSSMVKR